MGMVGLMTDWIEQAQAGFKKTNNPQWLQEKQQAALQQLQSLKAPSRQLESWRYADVSRLTKDPSSFSAAGHFVQQLPTGMEKSSDFVEIVVNESGYHCETGCPDWLVLQSFTEIKSNDWSDLSFDQETVVNLANTAMLKTGGMVTVKAINQTVKIKLLYDFDEHKSWQYVRNHFNIAEGAKLNIIEQHKAGRINAVNVFKLNAGVELNRVQNIQLNSSEQWVSFNQFEVAEKVDIVNMNHHIGGSLQHHLHWVNFNAEGSKYKSGSVNKSFDNNNITDIVNVNHNYKNNHSDVTHRSIAKDQSQIYNNAKALVAVGADGSEIEQDLKNILLSPDAKIFSKPELEIYADEVVAAHGSTIGALDDAALFYLQSRGIDIVQARDIMIESFEQEAQVN